MPAAGADKGADPAKGGFAAIRRPPCPVEEKEARFPFPARFLKEPRCVTSWG
jgi:hypothetical protein